MHLSTSRQTERPELSMFTNFFQFATARVDTIKRHGRARLIERVGQGAREVAE